MMSIIGVGLALSLAAGAAPLRVGLPAVTATARVKPELRKLAEQSIEQALRQVEGTRVVSSGELSDTLGMERLRQVMAVGQGKSSDGADLSELDVIVFVELSSTKVGFHLEARRVNAATKETTQRCSVDFVQKDAGTLGVAVSRALFPPAPVVVAPPTVAAAPPAEKPRAVRPLRVALLDVRATGAVPPRALVALDQSLPGELRKLEGVSAVSPGELRDLLSMERQKQLMGCTDNSECLAELAGALDADELISIDLVLVGQQYALSARRTDLRSGHVSQTFLRQFEQRDGEELLAVAVPLIEELYPERKLKPGKVRGVEAAVIRRLNPPPLPPWVMGVTLGGAVAAGVAGATFVLLKRDSEAQYAALLASSTTVATPGSGLKSLEVRATEQATLANAFFIAGGALAVTALVEAFFTDWKLDRAALEVAFGLGPSGALAQGTVRF